MLFASYLICTVMIVGGLLVDARNAFNSVDHVAVFSNARVLGCTVLASSSFLTGNKPNCLFRGLIFFA